MHYINENEYEEEIIVPSWIYTLMTIAIVLWVLAGIAAFIMSIACFGGSGTTIQNLIGFSIALFFGPLYYVYFFFSRSYCKNVKLRK
jgi:hypothetical protein